MKCHCEVTQCSISVQANGGHLGDAALCCHGDDAEIWLHEAPPSLTGCSVGGRWTHNALGNDVDVY